MREESPLTATAERLVRLAQSSEIAWWGDQLSVTVSVGGVVAVPGEVIVEVLSRTGSALREAISRGGNKAVVSGAPEAPSR